ncbi:VOC family protein [Tsukamurella sp. NPDC003166]|uniref:VOC family protein n=1 Tax=Tsukamurella sp. NPDC003166 TaxID=3154444 RepID=UPI0033ABB1F7
MTEYTAPVGAPVWIDLSSNDVEKSVDFYRAVFGWEADPPAPEFGGYRNFRVNGAMVAGLMAAQQEGMPDMWSVYLRTDDADASLAAAGSAGGTVVVPVADVGDLGRFGFFIDPAGAAIGVWQPGTHAGFAERGVPGTPYWFDCMSADYAASSAFYRTVFGWDYEEVGTGGDPDAIGPDRYSQVMVAGPDGAAQGVAGIMDAKPLFDSGAFGAGMSSFWQVYITVDDVAAAGERITAAGGTVVQPGEVTPWGTLAAARDANGGFFCYATPPAGM